MKSEPLNLPMIRARLAATRGKQFWRSLEEIADTKEFQQFVQREFPAQASEWYDELSRRQFLKIMGASLALAGLNACMKMPEEPAFLCDGRHAGWLRHGFAGGKP
jgi:MoCo/4Fe-4S cofactor protein with predicted Tat translocation signal